MRNFEYFEPTVVEEALSLLSKHGDEAKILAGGQSLMPLLRERLANPKYLINIKSIKGLDVLTVADGWLRIGAAVTHDRVMNSSLVKEKWPAVAEAASLVGDQQVRNRGTVCGSIAHADSSAEFPALAVALDAKIEIMAHSGERLVDARSFFTDFFQTELKPGEILTAVLFPPLPSRTGAAHVKICVRPSLDDFALVGVSSRVTLGPDDRCTMAGIALASVGPTPIRAVKAEKVLVGHKITPQTIKTAGATASEESKPVSDLRGSESYKRELVSVITRDSLQKAMERIR